MALRPSRGNQVGTTLIEVLVAVELLAFVAVLIWGVISYA